jgi:hypothetical protein
MDSRRFLASWLVGSFVIFALSLSVAKADCIPFGCGVVTFTTKSCGVVELSNQDQVDQEVYNFKEQGYSVDTSDPEHIFGVTPSGHKVPLVFRHWTKRVVQIRTENAKSELAACSDEMMRTVKRSQWLDRPVDDLSILYYDSDDPRFCEKINNETASLFLKSPRCCDVFPSHFPLCSISPHPEVDELPEFLQTRK